MLQLFQYFHRNIDREVEENPLYNQHKWCYRKDKIYIGQNISQPQNTQNNLEDINPRLSKSEWWKAYHQMIAQNPGILKFRAYL